MSDGPKRVKNLEALEWFSNLGTGREKRMLSLKEEINGLFGKIGRTAKYKIVS